MNELLGRASLYEYQNGRSEPQGSDHASDIKHAILIAAKNGVTEMVEKILELFPVAIHDMNEEKKNVVQVAVEHRQLYVYQLLLQRNILIESAFWNVDHVGNSALHLAATYGLYKPWLIHGAALQIMQWEIKWFEFAKESMPSHLFALRNNCNKTPEDIFFETHSELVKSGGESLIKTSESCSVVAALVAGVSFATSSTVPGGNDDNTGKPTLEGQLGFDIFAISALIALYLSVTALIIFLSILTSRKHPSDFSKKLPVKLLVALSSMFVSIFSMFISFCAAHSFVLEDKFKKPMLPLFAIMCLPVYYTLAEFPLYVDLFRGLFTKVQRPYN
ncbi:hypothetical protein K1719_028857 [Acacia pycnantha]|nr:hypothetical protein K1719_028857 [Acacia pycnantha]